MKTLLWFKLFSAFTTIFLFSPALIFSSGENREERQAILAVLEEKIIERGFAREVEIQDETLFIFRGGPLEEAGTVTLASIYFRRPDSFMDSRFTQKAVLDWEFTEEAHQHLGFLISDFFGEFRIFFFDSRSGQWVDFEEALYSDSLFFFDWTSWTFWIFVFFILIVAYYQIQSFQQSKKSSDLIKDAKDIQEMEKDLIEKSRKSLLESRALMEEQLVVLEKMNQNLEHIKESLADRKER